MKDPVDRMEGGPNGNNLASAAVQRHPVDTLQRNPFNDLEDVRRIYGTGLAMTIATERQMATRVGGRLPGMKGRYSQDSNCIMETLTGNDTKLDFGDFLSQPDSLPTGGIKDPRAAMERRLGM